ncbi:MAG: carboxypeptidase regulatory-like domain-containing protein, partial [Woeseiaceae bacterium]
MDFDALIRGMRILPAIVVLLAGSLAGAAAITDRMSLTEAIEAVRDQGFEIVYSSKLVAPWMRVRETPVDPDPLKALDEALAHYQLDLVEGPDGRWLIVASAPEEPPTLFAVRGRVLAADTGEPLGDARVRAKNRTAVTNEDGQFELSGLTAREVDLVIQADGYVGVRKKIDESAPSEPLQVSLQPVVLPQLEEVLIVASRYAMFDRRGLTDQFLTAD